MKDAMEGAVGPCCFGPTDAAFLTYSGMSGGCSDGRRETIIVAEQTEGASFYLQK